MVWEGRSREAPPIPIKAGYLWKRRCPDPKKRHDSLEATLPLWTEGAPNIMILVECLTRGLLCRDDGFLAAHGRVKTSVGRSGNRSLVRPKPTASGRATRRASSDQACIGFEKP